MVDPGWSRTESPFHAGELAIQSRLGISDRIDKMGRRLIREYITEQMQRFFTQLSYLIVGTVDESGNPWASIVVGKPGFISTPDLYTLQLDTKLLIGDPLAQTLVAGQDVGLLGIELANRRRNRINGVVSKIDSDGFEVSVTQTFGNCPQYIQTRQFQYLDPEHESQVNKVSSFGSTERNLIAHADTFFIATAYQNESTEVSQGADVSHRGGKPGFVRIDDERTLTIPDFHGNCYFNTLGNIELNPVAGLLFVDFVGGNLLYLTGSAEIIWSGTEVSAYQGAEQLVRFYLEKGYLVSSSLPLRWTAPEFSPQLEKTGSW